MPSETITMSCSPRFKAEVSIDAGESVRAAVPSLYPKLTARVPALGLACKKKLALSRYTPAGGRCPFIRRVPLSVCVACVKTTTVNASGGNADDGISPATIGPNTGCAGAPLLGPLQKVFADCVANPIVIWPDPFGTVTVKMFGTTIEFMPW